MKNLMLFIIVFMGVLPTIVFASEIKLMPGSSIQVSAGDTAVVSCVGNSTSKSCGCEIVDGNMSYEFSYVVKYGDVVIENGPSNFRETKQALQKCQAKLQELKDNGTCSR